MEDSDVNHRIKKFNHSPEEQQTIAVAAQIASIPPPD
jgi:hypothetical protein